MENNLQKNKKIINEKVSKKASGKVNEKSKKISGTAKQWLLVSEKTNLYFRNLKKQIREKYGVSFTYDKIVSKMIKCVDKVKFEEEMKRID